MNRVVNELLQYTFTTTDLHRRLRTMQEVLESVLYDEPNQLRVRQLAARRQEVLKKVAENDQDMEALLNLSERAWSEFTPTTLTTKMSELLKDSETLPRMTMYVPVEFTDKQLAPIAEWTRNNIEPGMLLDLHVDPKVVGGCAFVYQDRHFDWSLRRYIRSKRGLVTSLLNAYAE